MAVKYTRVDFITAGYNLFVFLFVLFFHGRVNDVWGHLAFNISVFVTIFFLAQTGERKGFFALRRWYPILLFSFFYYQTGLLNRVLVKDFLDPLFLKADERLFGSFLGIVLRNTLPGDFWSQFFHISYSAYYLVIPLTAYLLYRRDGKGFDRYIFQVSLLFYICYAIYVFLPVEGPLHLRNAYFEGKVFFERFVNYLYQKGENPGAAFPSSHVAVMILVAWWGRRVSTLYGTACGTVAFLLSLATIYCMFHYAVDVAAGVVLAAVYIFLVDRKGTDGKEESDTRG